MRIGAAADVLERNLEEWYQFKWALARTWVKQRPNWRDTNHRRRELKTTSRLSCQPSQPGRFSDRGWRRHVFQLMFWTDVHQTQKRAASNVEPAGHDATNMLPLMTDTIDGNSGTYVRTQNFAKPSLSNRQDDCAKSDLVRNNSKNQISLRGHLLHADTVRQDWFKATYTIHMCVRP